VELPILVREAEHVASGRNLQRLKGVIRAQHGVRLSIDAGAPRRTERLGHHDERRIACVHGELEGVGTDVFRRDLDLRGSRRP
jgi:hypothetical protein